jgi:hypothetical protein
MATLASLKLVAAKKPSNLSSAALRRNKLLSKLEEQIHLATAHNKGDTYAPTQIKSVTNATGERVQISQPKKIRPWWFVSDSGKVCIAIRYGAKVIELAKGKTAIEVSNPSALIEALEAVRAAVQAGELDAQLEAVSMKLRDGFVR